MIEHSGISGDGGIDGIVSQDPLGLTESMCRPSDIRSTSPFRARRSRGSSVHSWEHRVTVGVHRNGQLHGGARAEAERVNARIEAIDGRRLARLMTKHGVGVQAEMVVTLHRVDEDFFDAL